MSPKPRNKDNKFLPPRWRWKNGAIRYRVPESDLHLWDNKREFTLGKTLGEAYRTFAERHDFTGSVNTMDKLCDRYAMEVVPLKAPATQKSNDYSIARIRDAFQGNPVAAITSQHIYKYKDTIGERHSKKKANLDLEVLSHMFSKSIEWGARADHPMTGRKVTKFSLPSRKRYVTDGELVRFADKLSPKWQLLVSLAVWTGRRKAELLNLTRQDITEDGLRFRNVKKKDDVFVLAWTPEVQAAADKWWGKDGAPIATYLDRPGCHEPTGGDEDG